MTPPPAKPPFDAKTQTEGYFDIIRGRSPINETGDQLYVIGTFDRDAQAYTPQVGLAKWYGLTLWELRRALRALRGLGYQADRYRYPDGEHGSDPEVLVERVDGRTDAEVLEDWKR